VLRVLACVQDEHDFLLVMLAVGVCAATAAAAFHIHGISSQASGSKRRYWIFLTGVASGSGIWATHFVAMLALKVGPYSVVYDPGLTFVSLLIPILFTAAGFSIVGRAGPWWKAPAGGVLIGVGIVAMHYTGMAAVKFPGTIVWDPNLVLASVALGVFFAASATTVFHNTRPAVARWAAAALLTVAICSLHFTAMGAAVLSPDPTILVGGLQLDTTLMAMAIAGITLIVVLTGLAARIDHEGRKESVVRVNELANAAGEGIVVADNGCVINVNRHLSELCGRSPNELISVAVFGDLFSSHIRPTSAGTIETWLRSGSGGAIPVEVKRHPYGLGNGANEVYAVRDLRERRETERLRHLAHHDPLTGLPNRAALTERLGSLISRARLADSAFAILFVDVDGFKKVNDTHGHSTGDQMLCNVAQRLSSVMGATEFICRTGGDEFVILQDVPQQPEAARRLGL